MSCGKVLASGLEGLRSKPDSIESISNWVLWMLNMTSRVERTSTGVVRKFEEKDTGPLVFLVVLPLFKITRFVPKQPLYFSKMGH
ncbi:hypothetical protein AVEN_21282-1 [Araneus ventricosus]|uniref:Uncharacterized protein n=1 Tax=Araneus ventricosus TaxID=182803 RepID=A0A4Y2KDV7_ARAVE|nr:hypothetical protein AVEN_21282-1 [Araneus ventricosus]